MGTSEYDEKSVSDLDYDYEVGRKIWGYMIDEEKNCEGYQSQAKYYWHVNSHFAVFSKVSADIRIFFSHGEVEKV